MFISIPDQESAWKYIEEPHLPHREDILLTTKMSALVERRFHDGHPMAIDGFQQPWVGKGDFVGTDTDDWTVLLMGSCIATSVLAPLIWPLRKTQQDHGKLTLDCASFLQPRGVIFLPFVAGLGPKRTRNSSQRVEKYQIDDMDQMIEAI